jgi:hypothetical protein
MALKKRKGSYFENQNLSGKVEIQNIMYWQAFKKTKRIVF